MIDVLPGMGLALPDRAGAVGAAGLTRLTGPTAVPVVLQGVDLFRYPAAEGWPLWSRGCQSE
ncbi:hypothetical protein [Streptomyces sp. NPDC056387]|uniref:hypothetical protein n=1 Tax=Streptomyces sp. NPDC056387 TaxID=3345803 RepID=UPI0035D5E252